MTGSQKFALILGTASLMLFALAVFMYIKGGPLVDQRIGDVQGAGNSTKLAEVQLPSHDEIISELQRQANEKHVYWYVWCTAFYEGDEKKFSALASTGKALNIYVEDGATPYWRVRSYNSADEAAYALLVALKGEPTEQPQHKDKRVHCQVPPLEGGPK